jgi:4-carboxymuconolactone decarboxylase
VRKSTSAVLLAVSLFGPQGQVEAEPMKSAGLSSKQQAVVAIAAFTAQGDLQRLAPALSEGLDEGLTINETKEVLVQMYAYAGFPRSLNAITTFMDVLDARKAKGVQDAVGKEPSPFPAGKSSLELGTEVQTRLLGGPATARYNAFCPAIDTFLKAHLFGDILGRDNLDVQTREVATISALAGLGGVNPQLRSHFNVGLNAGLTEEQLSTLVAVVSSKVGKKQGDNASEVLASVLKERRTKPPPATVEPPRAGVEGNTPRMEVRRKGDQPPSQGPVEHFSGAVRVEPLFQAPAPARGVGANVTFERGARTAWHTHPLGQTLVVTAGEGLVQSWGGPVRRIRAGDVVWCPPGEKHWHGATPTTAMTHIAIVEAADGKTVQWMEKLTDAEYRAAANAASE